MFHPLKPETRKRFAYTRDAVAVSLDYADEVWGSALRERRVEPALGRVD